MVSTFSFYPNSEKCCCRIGSEVIIYFDLFQVKIIKMMETQVWDIKDPVQMMPNIDDPQEIDIHIDIWKKPQQIFLIDLNSNDDKDNDNFVK